MKCIRFILSSIEYLQFPNESDLHIGNDSYNMASLESFLRWEKLCEKTPKAPRMLLNGDPLDMTINKTLLNQSQPELSSIVWDNSSKHDSIVSIVFVV